MASRAVGGSVQSDLPKHWLSLIYFRNYGKFSMRCRAWMGDKKQCMFINENHPNRALISDCRWLFQMRVIFINFALVQLTHLQQVHTGKTLLWVVHKLYIFISVSYILSKISFLVKFILILEPFNSQFLFFE